MADGEASGVALGGGQAGGDGLGQVERRAVHGAVILNVLRILPRPFCGFWERGGERTQ
jgi:hypothetical protein